MHTLATHPAATVNSFHDAHTERMDTRLLRQRMQELAEALQAVIIMWPSEKRRRETGRGQETKRERERERERERGRERGWERE